jgi:hypothetical protein
VVSEVELPLHTAVTLCKDHVYIARLTRIQPLLQFLTVPYGIAHQIESQLLMEQRLEYDGATVRGLKPTTCVCMRSAPETRRLCPYCDSRKRQGPSRDISNLMSPLKDARKSPAIDSRNRSARTALDSAFTSVEESFLPDSVYRTPSRSRSRPGTVSPSSSPKLTNSADANAQHISQSTMRECSYTPMSAGFARLNRKDETVEGLRDLGRRGRLTSVPKITELDAKMFSGPA